MAHRSRLDGFILLPALPTSFVNMTLVLFLQCSDGISNENTLSESGSFISEAEEV